MVKNYLYFTKKLGPFPFNTSPLGKMGTFVEDKKSVIVGEVSSSANQKCIKKEDFNGRAVKVSKDGLMLLCHLKVSLDT